MTIGITVYENYRLLLRTYPQAQIKICSAEEKFEILFNLVSPLRAGIVSRPEDYRWNSLGYHVQTSNRDKFLSTDFGIKKIR